MVRRGTPFLTLNASRDVGSILIIRDSILLRRYEVTADNCIERSNAERNMDTRRYEVTADSCIERSNAERNMDTRRHGTSERSTREG